VNDEASPRPEPHDAPRLDSHVFRGEPAPGSRDADSLATPRWRRAHTIAVGAVALVLIGVALVIAQRMSAARQAAVTDPNAAAPLVTVRQVGRAPITATVNFTGGIVARYDMPIGVEGDGGRVSAVLVESGDRVKRGQVLARLEPAVVEAQVASLTASVEQNRAEAALAVADYRRASAIASSVGALSREEVDRRQSQVATSAARVKAAEAQLAEAEARLGRTEIRAPSDGIVLTRTAEVGQTAMPGGTTLFRLARGGEVEMRAQVAEQDLPRLKVGQTAEVYLTGIAAPFAGTVRLISAVIDPATRLGEVRVALQPHPDLRPGAFARGEVRIGTDLHPVVPQTAVLSDGPVNFVYVVGPDLHAVRRPVHIGGTQPQGIVIDRGLDGSEQVVTSAGAFLHEGERVRLAEPKDSP
jgi:RND family efflux transporter MFP subunit